MVAISPYDSLFVFLFGQKGWRTGFSLAYPFFPLHLLCRFSPRIAFSVVRCITEVLQIPLKIQWVKETKCNQPACRKQHPLCLFLRPIHHRRTNQTSFFFFNSCWFPTGLCVAVFLESLKMCRVKRWVCKLLICFLASQKREAKKGERKLRKATGTMISMTTHENRCVGDGKKGITSLMYPLFFFHRRHGLGFLWLLVFFFYALQAKGTNIKFIWSLHFFCLTWANQKKHVFFFHYLKLPSNLSPLILFLLLFIFSLFWKSAVRLFSAFSLF